MKPSEIDRGTMSALADAHVKRFENLIESAKAGSKNIRVEECEMYVRIWRGIQTKARSADFDFNLLAKEEQAEVRDAVTSGSYDELLEPRGTN
jgi:hypothetical protein